MAASCPCGSGLGFALCCEPYLVQTKLADTPEQLMRSRYSAYALGGFGRYLLATWFPPMAKNMTVEQLDQADTKWLGLTVLASSANGDNGEVRFEARYQGPEGAGTMRENSVFKRIAKRWYYIGGEVSHSQFKPPKRNEPCHCGSGKKYKQCCLK